MLTLNRFRAKCDTAAPEELPLMADGVEADRQGPSLMLLVDDAACRFGLRLHTFSDAESAASFIEFWFPPALRHGLIAFWALAERPAATGPAADFALLVRNPSQPGIVEPLSFPDARSGLACLATEMAAGLDPRRVLAYWTVPVAVSTGPSGEAKLSPVRPPVCQPDGPARMLPRPVAAPAAGQDLETSPRQAAAIAAQDVTPARRKIERSRSLVDLLEDARRVLRTARWPVRREAFQGFGSPPGRF